MALGKEEIKRLRSELGSRLKLTTKKGAPRDMSQREFAEYVDLSVRTIQWWELGRRKMGKFAEKWLRSRLGMMNQKFDWL